jgi:hypothetical protein
MSGFFILLVTSFLFDEPLPAPKPPPEASRATASRAETLPAPRKLPPAEENTRLISTTTQPPSSPPIATGAPTAEAKVGWGVDPSDSSMYMVIQIAPSAIETFAAGQRGQELTSRIPPMLRNRIEKVIVRFGTGPVEQFPSESELASMPLPKSTPSQSPQIANLDRRTPVTIDQPRSTEVIPTASTTQIPIVPGTNMPSTTIPNTTIPNTTMPSTVVSPTVTSPPPVWNNNTAAPRPTGTVASNDGFAPNNRVVPPSLMPFGSTRPTATQGNVTYSGTNNSGNNYGNAPYGTSTYGNIPLVANNPNTGVYPPVNEPILPNGVANNGQMNPPNSNPGFYNPNANYPTNPNYGVPVSTNGPTYAMQGSLTNPQGHLAQGPVLPPPNLLPSTTSGATTGSGWRLPPRDEQTEVRDVLNSTRPGSWVPFFLVLSFILNVYFGLWLNHLSTKYRHLLANVRGVSMPELERA